MYSLIIPYSIGMLVVFLQYSSVCPFCVYSFSLEFCVLFLTPQFSIKSSGFICSLAFPSQYLVLLVCCYVQHSTGVSDLSACVRQFAFGFYASLPFYDCSLLYEILCKMCGPGGRFDIDYWIYHYAFIVIIIPKSSSNWYCKGLEPCIRLMGLIVRF